MGPSAVADGEARERLSESRKRRLMSFNGAVGGSRRRAVVWKSTALAGALGFNGAVGGSRRRDKRKAA